MLKKIAAVVLAAGLWSGQASGTEAFEGNLLRLDVSYHLQSTALDDGFNKVTISESALAGAATYQSDQGFYGELGLGRVTIDEVEINRQRFDVDHSYSVRMFGLGYRVPRARGEGLYWGVGYRNTKANEANANPVNAFGVFWQKEQIRRYGIIGVGYSTGDDFNLLSVSGRHVWFGQSGIGVGVAWELGGGRTTTGFQPEVDIGVASLGALVMFRPRM